jgi:hypothetical protein
MRYKKETLFLASQYLAPQYIRERKYASSTSMIPQRRMV